LYDLLELPAKDLPEDRLRDHLHTLREDLYNPSKEMLSFLEDNPESRQEYIERLEELKDELRRRKDEGIIPDNNTDSESSSSDSESSSSDSDNIQEDLNSFNTQSGGSGDHGVGTSTATNNKSSTGSDTFSRVSNENSPDSFDPFSRFSNENSPDSFDNFFESVYLFDSLNLDSSILEFVILYLPYIRIVLLLLPFVFLLKISKLL